MEDWNTNTCPLCKKRHEGRLHFVGAAILTANGIAVDHPVLDLCEHCVWIASGAEEIKMGSRWPYGWKNPSPPRDVGYVKKSIPEELRWDVFSRDGMKCLACGSTKMLRADHVIPERDGGPTTLENLQTLCATCNGLKGRRRVAVARIRRPDHGGPG